MGNPWATDTLAGWGFASVLAVFGWWTSHKALHSGDQQAMMKFMLGGMMVRLLLCAAGLIGVLLTGLFTADSFITGLLAGIGVFLGVEVYGLHRAARRIARPAEGV
jgi:hypothetical protein